MIRPAMPGLIDSLIDYDRFLVCADFDSYWDAQMRVEAHWHDSQRLVAFGGAEHGADGLVLFGPDDSRVRHGDLESAGVSFTINCEPGSIVLAPDRHTKHQFQEQLSLCGSVLQACVVSKRFCRSCRRLARDGVLSAELR